MVSSKLLTGVLALLSVGAANGKVCYPTGHSTTLSTTTAETATSSTVDSSTATETEPSTVETTTSSSVEISTSSTTESSSVETTTASTTDSSSIESTTSTATDSSTVTSTVSTDATSTVSTSSSAETSSTYITITSTTASSTETETASTSTSTFFPAGLFPCQNDADCDLRGGVCDPMRCGCINLMCYLKTTTMATMTTTSLPEFACGDDTQCVGASFCLDRGVNACACVNALCVVTVVPLP